MKFNINLNVVKSKNNLEIARRYHHYDNVESMYITLKDDLYHIDAVVSVFNHIQKCSLEIKDNKVVSYKCACPFNDQDSMCGHLGAVIMKLNELEINDFPFEYQSEKLDNWHIHPHVSLTLIKIIIKQNYNYLLIMKNMI